MLQQTSAALRVIPYVKVLIQSLCLKPVFDVGVVLTMHIWIIVSGFCKSCSRAKRTHHDHLQNSWKDNIDVWGWD